MPTLENGKYYRIRSICSGKVVTLDNNNWATACLDANMDNQIFLAAHIVGDAWTLRSYDGRTLGYPDTSRETWVRGYANADYGDYKWDITQWKTAGGAEYRMWVHGASGETVLDLKDSKKDDGAWIWTYQPNGTPAQTWLFEEVSNPYDRDQ
ncbi:hypothetical protein H0H93_016064 [Arthromyces matolae]|nr:hypothetical protein H0H93_016064 [Arthromyces matolae]